MKLDRSEWEIVIAGLVIGIAAFYGLRKAGDALSGAGEAISDFASAAADAVNPTKDTNLAYKGVTTAVDAVGGSGTFSSAADHYFAISDILNPWADPTRKAYARKVWGLD